MNLDTKNNLSKIILEFESELLVEWLQNLGVKTTRRDSRAETQVENQCKQFLEALRVATIGEQAPNIEAKNWDDVRHLLKEISESRARQGFSSIETANFVFSLKQPLFARLRIIFAEAPIDLAEQTWQISTLLDSLGMYTIEVHQKTREQIIIRQQQELMELSTPVVQLWRDILALPLIGTLDSSRAQVVMESLLQKIIETEASIAIIDITGVPTVDTLVAQHLLKTVAAARLMGADCIISGIRPQIAQTIVHLGINLEDIITKATLADAFLIALKRTGSSITYSPDR